MARMPLLLLIALAAAPADIEAGRQLYQGACSGCHGATGEGSQGPSLLSGSVSRQAAGTLAKTIQNGLPGTSMPNFDLPDAQLAQLAAFVKSLTAPAIAQPPAGDAERGRALFASRCANCHRILGRGGDLGPDLSNAGAERTLHQLRESITQPSNRIAPGFSRVVATLTSGRVIEGLAKNHNNYSLQLLDRAGKLHLISRTELKSVGFGDGSLMPAFTDAAALPDLLAFLATQSVRPYVPEGSQP